MAFTDIAESLGDDDLRFDFHQRSESVAEKLYVLAGGNSGVSFRNVARH